MSTDARRMIRTKRGLLFGMHDRVEVMRKAGIAVLLLAFLAPAVWRARSTAARNRAVVGSVAAQLSSRQMSASEVRLLLQNPRYKDLTLREWSSDDWVVDSATQFGATNWIVRIILRDGRTTSIHVRTPDSDTRLPEGAPSDKSFN